MSVRTEKVSENIKRILGTIIFRDLNNPHINLITVTHVKVTADLKIARAYISVFNKDKREEVLAELDSAKGRIKARLAEQLRLKFMPDIFFHIDDTIDYVEKINSLLKEIHKDDNKEDN